MTSETQTLKSAASRSPSSPSPTLASGLWESLAQGYGRSALRADLLAGITVGIVALPLNMALAIATGVAPQYGLYTAIVAGLIAALLGGSRVSVTGPTAAFVVILNPITAAHGFKGLLLATLLAGLMLIGMGITRLGRLVHFIPHPVTSGFTAGIAVVIATLQVKDFFGLTLASNPHHFLERLGALAQAAPGVHGPDLIIGLLTLAVLLLWPRLRVGTRLPAPLVGILIGTLAAFLTHWLWPGFDPVTIASRFQFEQDGQWIPGIPNLPPLPMLPWAVGDDAPGLSLSLEMVRTLLSPAFAIALLGAIESLLCATVADSMIRTRHNPDAELIGQGIANLVAPFFGGFAATGGLARTATNIRAGGRTPLASIVHVLFLLAAVVVFAPLLSHLPMASLAALLLVVAWHIGDVRHIVRILKVAPRGDVAVLLTCFGLTVIFDMQIAIGVGVVLAALLFMKRMADFGHVQQIAHDHPSIDTPLPPGVILFDVEGPLFFGVAEKATRVLNSIHTEARVLILDMADVPAVDMTGIVALESAIQHLNRGNIYVVLAEVRPDPQRVLRRAGIRRRAGQLAVYSDLTRALAHVYEYMAKVHP